MKGLTIFSHSLRQVTGNLGMAVRVSGWLVLAYIVIAGVFWWQRPDWLSAAMAQDVDAMRMAPDLSASSIALFLLVVIILLVFTFWAVSLVAIVWHRYILLEEIPSGFIPYNKAFRVGRYFWYGFGISLVASLVVGMVSAFLGMIFGPLLVGSVPSIAEPGSAFFSGFIVGFILGTIIVVIYLRMALVLPAVALNQQLTIGQAWEATSGHTGEILVLALVLGFINAVVPLGVELGLARFPWVNFVVLGFYQWFYIILNISVLSTLYGYIVQKREVY